MAKKIVAPETQTTDAATALTALLKRRLPAVFEREPAPAYAEGALKALVADITNLFTA